MSEYYPTPATTGRSPEGAMRAYAGVRSLDVREVVTLTQAEYDALAPPSADTLYIVVG